MIVVKDSTIFWNANAASNMHCRHILCTCGMIVHVERCMCSQVSHVMQRSTRSQQGFEGPYAPPPALRAACGPRRRWSLQRRRLAGGQGWTHALPPSLYLAAGDEVVARKSGTSGSERRANDGDGDNNNNSDNNNNNNRHNSDRHDRDNNNANDNSGNPDRQKARNDETKHNISIYVVPPIVARIYFGTMRAMLISIVLTQ